MNSVSELAVSLFQEIQSLESFEEDTGFCVIEIERVLIESMLVLEARFQDILDSCNESGLAAHWESHTNSNNEIILQRLFFYSVALYKRGDTEKAQMIQESLSACTSFEIRAAVQIEQVGYFLNRGYYPFVLESFKKLKSHLKSLPFWDLHRLLSASAIALQAQGLYLESKHCLGRLEQALSKSSYKTFIPSYKRLIFSLLIESEDYEAACMQRDFDQALIQKSAIGRALWLLEHVRLLTGLGQIDGAEAQMQKLDLLLCDSGISSNVIAATEERVLIELHMGRFHSFQQMILEGLRAAELRKDVSLKLVLLMWQARQCIEFKDYERGIRVCTEALEMARARDLGKAKVRCQFMLVSLLFAKEDRALLQAVFDSLQNSARAIHLGVHRLLCEAFGLFVLGRSLNQSQFAQAMATLCNDRLLHCVEPLCREYALSGKVVLKTHAAKTQKVVALEQFLQETMISDRMVFVEAENALVYISQKHMIGLEHEQIARSGAGSESQVKKLWSVFHFSSQTLIDLVFQEIIRGKMLSFSAQDIHLISYPNVRFDRETHGSRVRVFIARLKKHLLDAGLPIQLNWNSLGKVYEVKINAEVVKVSFLGAGDSTGYL